MKPIVIPRLACQNWAISSELEWLETNGSGGFAMGTVAGANTRRYHSLLTVSLQPPVERYNLLSRVEEEVFCDGEWVNLGACQYPGVISPSGFRWLEEFRLDPFPTWFYQLGNRQLEKRFFLRHGKQAALLQYRANQDLRLRVRLFLAFRDYHSMQRAQAGWERGLALSNQRVTLRPKADLPPLQIHHNARDFAHVAHWYYQVEYRQESERGLDDREDLYSPGWLNFELQAGEFGFLIPTIENLQPVTPTEVLQWQEEEVRHRAKQITPGRSNLWNRLESAASQFLVWRKDGSPTIIAGYPWFTDWGRDTMISLPGLLIGRGRLELARLILEGFLAHLNQGLIPNRFPDAGAAAEYNTADATLWLFQAAWAYQVAGGDEGFLQQVLYPRAHEILAWHQRGTHYGIRMDPQDGLLCAGTPGTQLTWMDAKVGDWVVTPRHGKPVEINALWYNAWRMTSHWAQQLGEPQRSFELSQMADQIAASFESKFWNAGAGCLYDCLFEEGPDPRIRPNQIFAVSLPFPLMTVEHWRSIVRVVEERLFTPVGLRSLDPNDAEYRGRYRGGPRERDGAYHQGTIWLWLLGPFVLAKRRAFGNSPLPAPQRTAILERLAGELERGCLGTLPEIFEGDPPHRPVGAPAQAWSVAEAFRILALMSSEEAVDCSPDTSAE
ncbi:MAG: amylo-alpha-1,6-glucosidase [Bryobacteraceae bacterium]|nr:amylo-alpha-1,6-glucosidase [Bryobacteraceae bacterium]MDW8378638.1 amylo-alpha-1,6-glucosidase [Bryobacterales bacterium]